MGRSSTGLPKYTHIIPRAHYDNLSNLSYNPNDHIVAYSESFQESSIHSIQEVVAKSFDQSGYNPEDDEGFE